MAITTGEDHLPQVDIVERTARVGIAIDLDEYERLAKLYVEERFPYDRRLLELLRLSDFILWLRQRQRESVAEGYGHSHGKRRAIPDER